MNKAIVLLSPLLAALPVWAHEGHGAATKVHWHASDTFGLIATITVAALAIWLSSK